MFCTEFNEGCLLYDNDCFDIGAASLFDAYVSTATSDSIYLLKHEHEVCDEAGAGLVVATASALSW